MAQDSSLLVAMAGYDTVVVAMAGEDTVLVAMAQCRDFAHTILHVPFRFYTDDNNKVNLLPHQLETMSHGKNNSPSSTSQDPTHFR